MNNKELNEEELKEFIENDTQVKKDLQTIALLNAVSVVLIRKELTTKEELDKLADQSFNEIIKTYIKIFPDEVKKGIKELIEKEE